MSRVVSPSNILSYPSIILFDSAKRLAAKLVAKFKSRVTKPHFWISFRLFHRDQAISEVLLEELIHEVLFLRLHHDTIKAGVEATFGFIPSDYCYRTFTHIWRQIIFYTAKKVLGFQSYCLVCIGFVKL